MNKIIIIGILAIATLNSLAQSFEISPKISFGTGRIHSKNLVENFNYRNAIDKDIITWDVKQKFGFTFGIGGCFQYNITDNLSALVEPTFNSLTQKTTIDYFKNGLDGNGDGDKKIITSSIKMKTLWGSFPLMVQYGFGENKTFRVLGGLEFLFLGNPKIESDETKTTETYASNVLIDTKTEIAKVSGTIDVFKSPRTSFVIGLGTTFKISDKNLYLDLRYHLPLTKSAMYTTDRNYDDVVFKNNEVFDIWGKTNAEIDSPQFNLNDYKLGTIDFVIRYVLFKK